MKHLIRSILPAALPHIRTTVISISPFKFTANQARMAVAAAVLLGSSAADASGFYAYYTRLGFADAPEATLPGRTLTGKYADVVVRLPAGRFVFSREHSYLPYWEAGASKSLVPEIVARSGDGLSGRPDNINRCSYVRLIKANS